MRKLILGTALLAVIVLVACEQAAAPPPSIVGEWTVTGATPFWAGVERPPSQ